MHGRVFALVESNIVRDVGSLDDVERWSLRAGVMHPNGRIASQGRTAATPGRLPWDLWRGEPGGWST
jgi:hypothetical protein